DLLAEGADVLDGVVEVEGDAGREADSMGLGGAARGDRPRALVAEHLADRPPEDRARATEGDVADELLPDEPLHVVEGAHVEPGRAPDLGDRLDPRRRRPVPLAEADQLEPVVVNVSGLDDGRAE